MRTRVAGATAVQAAVRASMTRPATITLCYGLGGPKVDRSIAGLRAPGDRDGRINVAARHWRGQDTRFSTCAVIPSRPKCRRESPHFWSFTQPRFDRIPLDVADNPLQFLGVTNDPVVRLWLPERTASTQQPIAFLRRVSLDRVHDALARRSISLSTAISRRIDDDVAVARHDHVCHHAISHPVPVPKTRLNNP